MDLLEAANCSELLRQDDNYSDHIDENVARYWQAKLKLIFQACETKTVLSHREHIGPLAVQRPFYPENDLVHTYLLHPPGGVVGTDRIDIDIDVKPKAKALVTTPGATKFYKTQSGDESRMIQNISVASNASLEWLPQETIVFDGAQLTMQTKVELAKQASFIGWEVICLGRPAAQEGFDTGRIRQSFEIWRENESCDYKPIWIDRATYHGNDEALHAAWGLRGFSVTATMVMTGKEFLEIKDEIIDEAIASTKEILDDDKELFSITCLDEVLVARYLGDNAIRARQIFEIVWQKIRPVLLAREYCSPRIWHT